MNWITPERIAWAEGIATSKTKSHFYLLDETKAAARLGLAVANARYRGPDDPEKFRGFAAVIIMNHVINEFRAYVPRTMKGGRGRTKVGLFDVGIVEASRLDWDDYRQRLAQVLPEGTRRVFLLSYDVDGVRDVKEVARILGVTDRSVHCYRSRIHRILREYFDGQEAKTQAKASA
jgi:DNA-directed RNA polymerase specialized sigma24 family protein